MKRILFLLTSAALAVTAGAQETYENANIATEDLNGTARYVGMGGAMDALGADISTIATNPAGIGLFRHSTANVSFGFTTQQESKNFGGKNKTNVNFDQVGFVYSHRTGRNSFLNVAFNYHKSRNFNQILSAASALSGASQNKLSYMKYATGVFDLSQNSNGYLVGKNETFSQIDYLYTNTLCRNTDETANNTSIDYNEANGYDFNRESSGYIGEYDFNISGNINDRVYLGLTFGISDVHYKGFGEYSEGIVDVTDMSIGGVRVADERRITGTGFNVKGGIIFRPVEESPFRIGLSIATPTWYDLTTRNDTYLYNNTTNGDYKNAYIGEDYEFKLYTPWKFGLSLGTTVGRSLALGATYEYADYGSLDSRINTGSGYDDWGYYYDTSESDRVMNDNTEDALKGVHTLKLGLEFKPENCWAIRLGYNYVSPMYDKDDFKDVTLESPGTYYSSSTDYTNWKSTNRLTCGFGYLYKNFSVDLAYQYSVTNGDFYPFMSAEATINNVDCTNYVNSVKVDNKRHQVLLTLGYHF